MSYSTLVAIEKCPLSWSLQRARYTQFPSEKGYPDRARLATLAGQAIHIALERIVGAVASAGCRSATGPDVVPVLKGMGGLTQVLRDATQEVLARLGDNPRVRQRLGDLTLALDRDAPAMRQRLQTLLGAVRVGPPPDTGQAPGFRKPMPRPGGLSLGIHAEVTLRNTDLDWIGKADLVTISGDECEIADFKTGQERDSHRLQVRIYAMLWARDTRANPDRKLATSLRLIYKSFVSEVPAPTEAEIAALAREVAERTNAAQAALSLNPPTAVPARGSCELCGVRQLCEPYWEPATQAILASHQVPAPPFVDAEIVVREKQGPSCWRALISRGASAERGTEVLVRVDSESPQFASLIEGGRVLRILDAHRIPRSDETGELEVLSLGAWSEAYVA